MAPTTYTFTAVFLLLSIAVQLQAQESFGRFEYHAYDDPIDGRIDVAFTRQNSGALAWHCTADDELDLLVWGDEWSGERVEFRFDGGEKLGPYELEVSIMRMLERSAGSDSLFSRVEIREEFPSLLAEPRSRDIAERAMTGRQVVMRLHKDFQSFTTTFDLTGSMQALNRLSCR